MSGERTRRVLLVEDSDAIRDAFSILLEDAGYAVAQAGTGGEALRQAGERVPDLVLLDMGLPDISGLEVVRRLKAGDQTAHVPVVALTGRDDPRDREACLSAGCTDYLVKPVDTRKLLGDIRLYLGAVTD